MSTDEGSPRRGDARGTRPEDPKEPSHGTQAPGRNDSAEEAREGSPQSFGGSEVFLASTSYIEDTSEAQLEARRVSKALKQIRWNVTPPYAISTIFSDILCITSESGSIPKALIDKIEGLGYSFSGFEANNSRPLAWIKRKEEPEPPAQPRARADAAELDELARTIQDQGTEIEKEMTRLEEERRKIAEDLKTLAPAGEPEQQ